MTDIDHSHPIPLYYQLKILIKEQIESGKLRPGDKIPTETELCERYKLSRTPVRQALIALVNEGLLIRKAGRGTFVSPIRVEKVILQVIVPDTRWQWPLEEAARLLNRDHPEVMLELEFSVTPLYDLHDHLSMVVAQGQAPDISVIDSVWVAEFAHRRYLYPIDELDSDWVVDLGKSIYPSLLEINSHQGILYAVPTTADATVLWFRRDWLSSEGSSPPRTWADLLSIGRKFQSPEARARYGIGSYPLAFVGGHAGGETTTYQLLPFIWAAGGDLIFQEKVTIDSEATRAALTFLKDLVHSEKLTSPDAVDQPWDGALHAFAKGEVVMAFGGTYENYLIRHAANWDMVNFMDRVGFVPLPAGPGGVPTALTGGMTYGIYRQSRHPMIALAVLQQMLTPEILKPFSLRTGQISANKAVTEVIGTDEDGFLGRTAFLFDSARSRPSLPTYEQVSLQFRLMIETCLTDQISVEGALHRAAERISGITGLPIA
ncbi:MAG: extracellular solute-binding protein [Chloroflexota bacterium]|nr:extracellular solute-binding protein [Chloroflexota bacterium]